MTNAEEVAAKWTAKERDLGRLLQLTIQDFDPKRKAYLESLEVIRQLVKSADDNGASISEIVRATGLTRGFIRNILGK